MNTRHRYADAIIAWANGQTIQYRDISTPKSKWEDWNSFQGNPHFDLPNLEWRVKPRTRTVHFKVVWLQSLDNYADNWIETIVTYEDGGMAKLFKNNTDVVIHYDDVRIVDTLAEFTRDIEVQTL